MPFKRLKHRLMESGILKGGQAVHFKFGNTLDNLPTGSNFFVQETAKSENRQPCQYMEIRMKIESLASPR